MNLDRRSLLKGIGAAGATLAFSGYATANSGKAQYIAVGSSGIAGSLEDAGFDVTQELADGGVYVVHGPEDATTEISGVSGVSEAVRDVELELETPEESELIEADEVDGGVESDWYENLWDKQRSEAVAANDIATGDGTEIGIIDTGVDYAHPDLIPNLQKDAGRLFREGDIRSGVESDIVVNNPGQDQIQRVEQHVASDVNGHGTHVAGIAAADSESGVGGLFGSGVQGVAPDADLISYRVFWWIDMSEDGDEPEWVPTTTTADVLTSIDFGATQGLDVLNLSLGTPPFPPRVHQNEALRTLRLAYERVVRSAVNRGTVVVASAGNAGTDLQKEGLFSLPNSTKGAMSISSLGPNDERSFFSNYGTNEIDVGAGGGAYESRLKTLAGVTEWVAAGTPLRASDHPLDEGDDAVLYLDEDGTVVFDPDDAAQTITVEAPAWPYPFNLVFSTTSPRNEGTPYSWKAGTSMSAPNTAGLVALVRELDPDANPSQVESAIKKGTVGPNGRNSPDLGAGRINAVSTVESVEEKEETASNGNLPP